MTDNFESKPKESNEQDPTIEVSGSSPTKIALIKDRYRIVKELGRGGMGVVYLAHDVQLHERPVVIKVLRDQFVEDWIIKKFRQEIEALVRIEHPGVVGIFDAGQMPNGQMFVVMQFVEGTNLRAMLSDLKEPIAFETAARILGQVGRALTAAHDKGVLHCDLKPENIMLQNLHPGEEVAKLIDFGIAKIRDSQVTSVEPTRVAGTMEYMAPEQLNGAPSAASDIFSLGVISYEMLTGKKPYPAKTLFQLFEMHKSGIKDPPRNLRPDLPEASQNAILKALSSDPDHRFKRARDFTDELVRTLTFDAPVSQPRTHEFAQTLPQVKKPASKSGKTAIQVAVALVSILIVALLTRKLFQTSDEPAPKMTTSPPVIDTQSPDPIPAEPEMLLHYSILVQKFRDNKPFEDPFKLASEILFEADYRIQLQIAAPEAGNLYILNEGPAPAQQLPQYVVLSPSKNDSPQVEKNQEIKIPSEGWLIFDKEKGTEKVWIVYSRSPISQMEAVKGVVEVTDPDQIRNVQSFLKDASANKAVSQKDIEKQRTILTAKGDRLVHLLLLDHY